MKNTPKEKEPENPALKDILESPKFKFMRDLLVKGILQAMKDDGELPEGTRI